MARAPATTPRRRADEPAAAVELTLLSRVAYRGQEITGPRLRGLLALLAGDLRTGCSTARLVEGLWPDELPEHPTKALQVARLPRPGAARRRRHRQHADRLPPRPRPRTRSTRSAVLRSAVGERRSRPGRRPRGGARARRGRARAVGGGRGRRQRRWTTRWPRCAPNGRRPTGRWPGPARSRCPGWAATPRRSDALARLARERPRDEEVLVELLRGEAATVGPSAALDRYEAYRRCAARRARYRPRRRPPGRPPASCCRATAPVVRHGVALRAEPAARPRRRHRRGGATCCARSGSPRSSGPAASARPGSRTW